MNWFFCGLAAFVCLVTSDYGKYKAPHFLWNALFLVGSIMLAFASARMLDWNLLCYRTVRGSLFLSLCGALACAAFIALIYTLFFALPFSETYLNKDGGTTALDHGVYGICRHPGIWPFSICYICLAVLQQTLLFWGAAITYILLDIFYVVWQDKYLFPKTLAGYTEYKKSVPFLIPRFIKKNP